jgi:hypothetical protein
MSEEFEKLRGYLSYHSFIKEVMVIDGTVYFSTNLEFSDPIVFINRFSYLDISYNNEMFCIENKEFDLLQASAELEKFLVA